MPALRFSYVNNACRYVMYGYVANEKGNDCTDSVAVTAHSGPCTTQHSPTSPALLPHLACHHKLVETFFLSFFNEDKTSDRTRSGHGG